MLITQFKLRDAIFLSAVLVFLTVSLKDSAIGVFLTFVLVTIYVIYRNYRLTEIIFLVYPIKFILTGMDITNFYILLFLEFFIAAGLIHAAFKLTFKKHIVLNEYTLIAAMLFFAMLTDTIDLVRYNLSLVEYLVSVKSFAIPLFLLFVMSAYLEKYPQRLATVSSALITGLVISSSIAITNYFMFFYEGSGVQAYAPYLQYMGDGMFIDGRNVFGEYLPRLNLLYGGAIGSLAGIQALFALLIFLTNINNFSKVLVVSLILISSIATISYSLLAACLIMASVLIYIRISLNFFLKNIMIILIALFIIGIQFSSNNSLFDYIVNLVGFLTSYLASFVSFDIFLIGTHNYVPSSLYAYNSFPVGPIDIGIVRGLLDYGVFYFLSNILFYVFLFIKIFKVEQKGLKIIALSFLIVVLLSIHSNIMLKIPVTLMMVVLMGYVNMAIKAEKNVKSINNYTYT
jgi:hypothetical protein